MEEIGSPAFKFHSLIFAILAPSQTRQNIPEYPNSLKWFQSVGWAMVGLYIPHRWLFSECLVIVKTANK